MLNTMYKGFLYSQCPKAEDMDLGKVLPLSPSPPTFQTFPGVSQTLYLSSIP